MTSTGASGRRLRVLLVTRNFPPLLGGMEKFNFRLFGELAKSCDVALCGPAGCAEHAPAGTDVVEVPGRGLAAFLIRLTWAALRTARGFRPDVILAGSGLTAPIALAASRLTGARYAVFVYGLDLVVGHRVYQWLWVPAIRRADVILPISEYTRRVAIEQGLDPARMTLITPGVDMPARDPRSATAFREQFSLAGRPMLLAVGRLTRRKGIAEFVANVLPTIAQAFPEAILVVIGGEPADALAGNRGGATARVLAAADEHGIARNVLLLGRRDDDVLAAALQAADVHVFPVIEIPGDVEGFGMVAIEAAASGLPTVAFRAGGIPDAVADGVSGALLAPGDYAGMASAIERYLRAGADRSRIREACIAHARRFDWRNIGHRLVTALAEGSGAVA
jgi:phosphatidyl-myo-inositol dimannoside synthase